MVMFGIIRMNVTGHIKKQAIVCFYDKTTQEIGRKSMTDRQDYERFLAGDIKGFEELVIRHKNGLIYFINRYVKDISAAEDIAQDVFVEFYLHKERYNPDKEFKTYIYTIGHNRAVDYIRKNSRLVFVDEYTEQMSEEDELFNKVVRDEEKSKLHKAIRELKSEYQAAITLIDIEAMSYDMAAAILGKTPAQMKILIFRARKSLAKKIKGQR